MILCQNCKKHTATVHLTDLAKGEKRERHLCEQCAAQEGVTIKQHVSINEVLNSFLMCQPGVQELSKVRCPQCGLSFAEFRSQGVLGCPHDYETFGEALGAVVERAQDGHTHHTGKSPGQTVITDPVQSRRMNLQRELRAAVEAENYELAAQLRDQLAELDLP